MVKETRIVFELCDVSQVRIVCVKCNGEIARSLTQSSNPLPNHCPHCLVEWWDHHDQPTAIQATIEALKSIARLIKVLDSNPGPITVRLEIDDD